MNGELKQAIVDGEIGVEIGFYLAKMPNPESRIEEAKRVTTFLTEIGAMTTKPEESLIEANRGNQFIFCIIVDGQILYGTLKAEDGSKARQILEEKFKDRKIKKLEIKGVASKTYDFDVVSGITVAHDWSK